MDDLNDMKAMWIELNNKISSLEGDNRRLARQVMDSKFKTAQEKLADKYATFIGIELVFAIVISFFILFNPEAVEKYRVVTAIYWGAFFLGEAAIDAYLMLKVKEIDVYRLSVSEIARRAARNWKIHKIAIAIGLPVAIGAAILFGLLLNANIFTIYGMIVGGVIGLAIGIRQLLQFMKYYKFLQSGEQ